MIGHLFVAILRQGEPGMACRAEPKDSICNNLGILNQSPRTSTGESGLGLSEHGHPLKGRGGIAAPLRESDQTFDLGEHLVLQSLGLVVVLTDFAVDGVALLGPHHH